MKSNSIIRLRKLMIAGFLLFLLQPAIAQNCPTVTSWNIVTVSNDGLGNCTYRVNFTMTVNGSNKSVQVLVTCGNAASVLNQCITVSSSQNGVTLSSNTFTCNCTAPRTLIFNSFTNGACGGASCTTSGNVLPVVISSFRLKQVNNSQCLTWVAEDQGSVQNFTIEYSSSGTDFVSAGSVMATGSGNQTEYSFCDPVNRQSGFYRLKINETGGQVKYSSVIKFSVKKDNAVEIFPNPAAGRLNIEMPASGIFNNAAYMIFAQDGRKVLSGKLTSSFIDISKLPAGIYNLNIRTEEETLLQKVFVKN